MNCRLKHPQSKSLTIKFIFLSYSPPQPMKKEASQCNYKTVRPTIVKICLNFSLTAGHGCRHSTHNGRYCPPVKCTELKNIYLSPNRRDSFLRERQFYEEIRECRFQVSWQNIYSQVLHLPPTTIPPYTPTTVPFIPSFPLVSKVKLLSSSELNTSSSSIGETKHLPECTVYALPYESQCPNLFQRHFIYLRMGRIQTKTNKQTKGKNIYFGLILNEL